jgi:hypothetical protein
MADIAAGDVAYTIIKVRKLNGNPSRKMNRVKLVFGNGALTYPAAGIPISIGKLGCPVDVESLAIVDKGTSGYSFMYDQSAKKLVMFQSPAQTHAHDMFILGGQTHDATLGLNVASLGKNAATNITLNGANSATTGGVVSATLAAAASVEPSAVAIAAQTIEVEVIGW